MKRVLILVVLGLGLLGAASASALTFLFDDQPDGRTTILYRFQKPSFGRDVGTDLLSGYHELGVHLPVAESSSLVFALPLARAGYDNLRSTYDKNAFGNVYVGFHRGDLGRRRQFAVNAGVFLPTAQAGSTRNAALEMGMLSDPNRLYRFYPDFMTFHLALDLDVQTEGGLYVQAELGPNIMMPTGDRDGEAELLSQYGIGLGSRQQNVEIGIELAGWWVHTSDGASFSESSTHFLTFGAEYKGRVVSPSVFLTNPLDEDLDVIDWLLGFRIKMRVG